MEGKFSPGPHNRRNWVSLNAPGKGRPGFQEGARILALLKEPCQP